MNGLDVVIGVIALVAVLRGLWRGGISQVFGILGVSGGLWIAATYYESVSHQVYDYFSHPEGSRLVAFGLLFGLSWIVFGTIGHILTRAFQAGGLGMADRILGGSVGFVKALILAVAIVSVLTLVLTPSNSLLHESILVPHVRKAATVLLKAAPAKYREAYEERVEQMKGFWKKGGRDARLRETTTARSGSAPTPCDGAHFTALPDSITFG